mmetsp:Transcript_15717/g.36886  ORF Transcript_15717/g.36886 Transcript_15717/m.36886 type:complete len:226 (-) Transcript_15717:201-878(-)
MQGEADCSAAQPATAADNSNVQCGTTIANPASAPVVVVATPVIQGLPAHPISVVGQPVGVTQVGTGGVPAYHLQNGPVLCTGGTALVSGLVLLLVVPIYIADLFNTLWLAHPDRILRLGMLGSSFIGLILLVQPRIAPTGCECCGPKYEATEGGCPCVPWSILVVASLHFILGIVQLALWVAEDDDDVTGVRLMFASLAVVQILVCVVFAVLWLKKFKEHHGRWC